MDDIPWNYHPCYWILLILSMQILLILSMQVVLIILSVIILNNTYDIVANDSNYSKQYFSIIFL